MKVFKFGGASVKDADAIRNVASILKSYSNDKIAVVVSAMGKTTNAMEKVVDAYWNRNQPEFLASLSEREAFHLDIMNNLYTSKTNPIFEDVKSEFELLRNSYDHKSSKSFNYEYDQIVSIGEVISSKIINAYLLQENISSTWMDARKLIRTNDNHREAEVDWEQSTALFQNNFLPKYTDIDVQVTQGFIGHTAQNATTTLGREGSDFTAGIVAFCCDAESVTIWKDVPGMLNADPKWFDHTIKLESISFREAIELSYYGASVIHPKTIKPLQNKKIPLYVKSFLEPEKEGTIIQSSTSQDHLVPSFIFKMNQILFSITPKDFSFIVEKNLSDIFNRFAKADVKINLMQNSALQFSVLLDEEKVNIDSFLALFEDSYKVKFNAGLELVTIRHYDQATLDRVSIDKEIILQQKTRETARLIVKQK